MSTKSPTPETAETPAKKPRRRRGKPRPGRYYPPGYHSRARLAETVAAEVTRVVAPPAPAPQRRKPRPRYWTLCPTCSRKISVSATFTGVRYCEEHVNPAKRPAIETEADVIKRMQSAGIAGARTASTASRHKRHRERFDTSDRDYL